MRRRFRAWHTEEKTMYYDPLINGLTGEVCICDQGEITGVYDIETVIPLQWTGLKDGNGAEIFEGDILEDFIANKRYEVIWDDYGMFLFNPVGTEGQAIDYYEFEEEVAQSCTIVVGNIFEDWHLLERSQIG